MIAKSAMPIPNYVATIRDDEPPLRVCRRPSVCNTQGTIIPLFANWYRVEDGLTGKTIHQYNISMNAVCGKKEIPVTKRQEMRMLFWHCVRNNEDIFGPFNEIIFADASAFSLNCWKAKYINKAISVFPRPDKPFFLRFEYVSRFTFDLNSENDSVKSLSATLMKSIVYQRILHFPSYNDVEWNFINRWHSGWGSIYYVPWKDSDPKVFIDAGVRAWLGAYASVKVLQDRSPALALGLVNKLFHELDMSLVEFYCEVLGETGIYRRGDEYFKNVLKDKGMSQAQRAKANRLLSGVRLKSTQILVKDRKYCYRFAERRPVFVELCGYSAMTCEMPKCCGRHQNQTMADVYNGLQKRLEFPWLPICKVKVGRNSFLAPLEVLRTNDKPQHYSKMMSENMRMEFIKKITRKPDQHKQLVESIFHMMEFDSSSVFNFLNSFKINIAPNMIQLNGMVLDAPIAIDKDRNEVPLTEQRAIKRKEINEAPAGEVVCAVIIMGTRNGGACVTQDQAKKFFNDLVKKCRERGLCMSAAPFRVYDNTSAEEFERYVMDAISRFSRIEAESREQEETKKILLLLIINDRHDSVDRCTDYGEDSYGFMKSICDNSYGVASQVVDASTVIRATVIETKTIYYNIALKINAKLGGINQAVVFDDDSRSAECMPKDATMYVGIDVTHPTGDNDYDISIASMVANIDLAATRYKSKILVQMRKRETVECFDAQFRQLMLSFKEHSDVWPSHIVIFRDGLSDSEMVRTASIELSWIRKSWECLSGGRIDTTPTYTYIVIQKQHVTRFYKPAEDETGHKTYVNVPSGTVIDKKVVSPTFFDFYLASQIGAIGTTRPAHYTVIFDDWGLRPDRIYELCYRLCFLYARCRVPVSLPCPVYYSHLVCGKAKEVYKSLLKRNVFDSIADESLRKSEIEKRLSVRESYPGMHFV